MKSTLIRILTIATLATSMSAFADPKETKHNDPVTTAASNSQAGCAANFSEAKKQERATTPQSDDQNKKDFDRVLMGIYGWMFFEVTIPLAAGSAKKGPAGGSRSFISRSPDFQITRPPSWSAFIRVGPRARGMGFGFQLPNYQITHLPNQGICFPDHPIYFSSSAFSIPLRFRVVGSPSQRIILSPANLNLW
jgi:hypothetical protein